MTANNWAALLTNTLTVGSVIYTWCDFCTPPKDKFLVVASTEPKLLVLVINSEIHPFYFNSGQDRYHVIVPLSEHDFLNYDSYANCVEAHASFDLTDIHSKLLENFNKIHKGHLSDECLRKIYEAVSEQKTMIKGHKNEIIDSIKQKLEI